VAQGTVLPDIFAGADRIEILGKLPTLLWAYISKARQLVENVGAAPEACASSVQDLDRLLVLLQSAAAHLGNEELERRIGRHSSMLSSFSKGELAAGDLISSLNSELPGLEAMAGPKPELSPEVLLDRRFMEKELDKAEKVRVGRSADVVVSAGLLDEIRDFLATEVMTEGISSILVIDDAGTLIVKVGDRVSLDEVSLAAVAAANFAATEKIARLIGERDFVLLFYKGHNESFHFTRVGKEYIIVTIFNNSLSLGLLRLRIANASQVLEKKLPKRGI
jgi:predicted regulator of Ras-like GTPase activity (Roadblock/LC7/MglB family)